MTVNPYRSEVLRWYRTILKSAFKHPWKSDSDALYVAEEARRLFRGNMHITDCDVIERKVREAEMRHGLAVHYSIPFPRMMHKTTLRMELDTTAPYAPYMDSLYRTTPYDAYEHSVQQAHVDHGDRDR